MEKRTRSPIVDGLFYPEDPAGALSYMRDIEQADTGVALARAVIAPHGAWEISGRLTGAAFASASGRKNLSRIVVMGPVHDSTENGIFLSASHSFQTPLGELRVDQEASKWLESYSPLIRVNDIPHLREHSIEVLLPFLKYFFPKAAIVPILMCGHEKKHIGILANALRAAFAPNMEDTLLAVSFNLVVHPGNGSEMQAVDECVELFRKGNLEKLRRSFDGGRIAGCGDALVNALMQSTLIDGTLPRMASQSLLNAIGEKDNSVYYGAFSFV